MTRIRRHLKMVYVLWSIFFFKIMEMKELGKGSNEGPHKYFLPGFQLRLKIK